ncbi:hypothetical protein BU24DRAFT_213667 [Aaosphaeria arxii CBS 175.79]|uniref:Uncharacterized protein n=1 Tax=Aaosphaeria arxii CBS 175.79 TaxID=1450172 RepID=A0A6A5XNU1_9PLEO|nr:uncharacterized protein BU24DRAFT_213667 [Aaosphaeria arxii CBS 175.79]KAF2014400.1 hypothetical protein BU24DRAFT_213667 [Aaosphaeria arxii CBS 175.79]
MASCIQCASRIRQMGDVKESPHDHRKLYAGGPTITRPPSPWIQVGLKSRRGGFPITFSMWGSSIHIFSWTVLLLRRRTLLNRILLPMGSFQLKLSVLAEGAL